MADLQSLSSFPPEGSVSDREYDTSIKAFIKKLDKLPTQQLTQAAGTDRDLLKMLNPSLQSLAYLYTLLAHIAPYEQLKASNVTIPPELLPSGAVWGSIVSFMGTFDSVQIRYAPKQLRRLLNYIWRVASTTQLPQFAIGPIRDCMLSLDSNIGVLTSYHLLVLRTCLSCRMYADALPLLDKIIHTFPTKDGSAVDAPFLCSRHVDGATFITVNSSLTQEVTVHDIQEYFLLGAMCYIALKRWEDAQMCLEHVLVIPAGVATGMMVEAYRKWVLVGCLAHGTPPKPPKLINPNTLKDLKAVSKGYDALADIFQGGDPARLAAELDAGMQLWADDGNAALAQQLLVQLQRYFVVKLEKTYSAVPVATVAGWLKQSPEQAQQYLQLLIDQGQLSASIEAQGAKGILRFATDPSTGPRARSEAQQLLELQTQAARTRLLNGYVRDADRKVSVTRDYVQSVVRRENEKAAAAANAASAAAAAAANAQGGPGTAMPGAFGDAMDTSWDAPDGDDEDLMEELH